MSEALTTGNIFNIQRYSIHDGPGIRTILFLKGCPLLCPWCSNPESQNFAPELEYTRSKCIGCGYCVSACQPGALFLGEDGVVIDRTLCTLCGDCASECWAKALEIVGQRMTVDGAFEIIERDRAFYESSGGGVTLSGGEPLMQADFAAALLKKCREAGINSAIETTGFQNWHEIEKLLPYTDVFLYDIKLIDSERHRAAVGVENGLILENARKLAALSSRIIVRVPVIPGVNDDFGNLVCTVRFAADIGAERVNLLPYHRLGENKYRILGREYPLDGTLPPSEADMGKALAALKDFGIPVSIGG